MSKAYSLATIDDIFLQNRQTDGRKIPLSRVYNALSENKTFPEIQDEIEGITPKSILLARAFYMAANPVQPTGRRQQYLRVLCDANIDESYLTDGARQIFGYATHTNFDGLTDAKDSQVWARSCGRYNLIVTKDSAVKESLKTMDTIDLTRCALLRWKTVLKNNGGQIDETLRNLPVLVHIKDSRLKGHEIKNLLRKHRNTIFEIYDERVSPVIEVSKNTAKPGIHFLELMEGGTKERAKKLRDTWVDVIEGEWFKGYRDQGNFKHVRAMIKRVVEYHIGEELALLNTPQERKDYFDLSYNKGMANFGLSKELSSRLKYAVHHTDDVLLKPLSQRLSLRKQNGETYSR
ncbi:MAG: hypothetical protein COB76_01350 [Alphaproteobacteria bacterium]|nr:MAG: hypothetical protein COB76_01350 [Alphaproteobacteria bacterium]